MADWSAVYLRNYLGTGAGFAAAGYAAFSLTMALGRFTGDRAVAAYGPVRLARRSALIAAAGLGVALAIGHPIAAIAGFACVGLGLSNQVPLLFRAAARSPGISPGVGIASVSTAGYFGFLAGPPVIGLMAELTGLPTALGLVVGSIGLVAIFAHLLRAPSEQGAY
jgi:fucose permease